MYTHTTVLSLRENLLFLSMTKCTVQAKWTTWPLFWIFSDLFSHIVTIIVDHQIKMYVVISPSTRNNHPFTTFRSVGRSLSIETVRDWRSRQRVVQYLLNTGTRTGTLNPGLYRRRKTQSSTESVRCLGGRRVLHIFVFWRPPAHLVLISAFVLIVLFFFFFFLSFFAFL